MKTTIFGIACALALATGCSKKTPSCDELFAHTVSIAPEELRPLLEGKKAESMAKCAKLSDEAKQCAMAAKTMPELQKCPRE